MDNNFKKSLEDVWDSLFMPNSDDRLDGMIIKTQTALTTQIENTILPFQIVHQMNAKLNQAMYEFEVDLAALCKVAIDHLEECRKPENQNNSLFDKLGDAAMNQAVDSSISASLKMSNVTKTFSTKLGIIMNDPAAMVEFANLYKSNLERFKVLSTTMKSNICTIYGISESTYDKLVITKTKEMVEKLKSEETNGTDDTKAE